MILQMDSLKLQLLNGADVDKTRQKLRDMKLESEVADVALEEIRTQLIQLLEAEVQQNYDKLSQ